MVETCSSGPGPTVAVVEAGAHVDGGVGSTGGGGGRCTSGQLIEGVGGATPEPYHAREW